MLSVCPLYLLRITFDPSLPITFFLLAPMNAAVYGSAGLVVGYALLAFGIRRSGEWFKVRLR
jgi:hypothetical protein